MASFHQVNETIKCERSTFSAPKIVGGNLGKDPSKKSLIAYPVTRSHIGYIYTQSISESFFQVDIFLKHFSYFGSIDILRVGIHFELHMLILNAARGTTN